MKKKQDINQSLDDYFEKKKMGAPYGPQDSSPANSIRNNLSRGSEYKASVKASTGMNSRHKFFEGSGSSYGYASKEARVAATAGEHLKRAGIFASAGSGMKRETALNAVGLLTKHQKAETLKAGAGFLARSQKWLIPGGALLGLGANAADGGGLADYLGGYVAPEIGARIGINVGKNLGFGASKMLGLNLMAGGVIGGTLGVVSGLAIGAAVGYLGAESADSNNIINHQAHDMMTADFETPFEQNNNTLTHRQRAINKLSKSSLNDRGTLLGNEAQVLAGIL